MDIFNEINQTLYLLIETLKFIGVMFVLMGVMRFGNWLDRKLDEKYRKEKQEQERYNNWRF